MAIVLLHAIQGIMKMILYCIYNIANTHFVKAYDDADTHSLIN